MSRDDRERYLLELSAPQIALLIQIDPSFTLARGAWRRRERMAEARRLVAALPSPLSPSLPEGTRSGAA